MIRFEDAGAVSFLRDEIDYTAVFSAEETLLNRNCPGAEFSGWIDLPRRLHGQEFREIREAASRLRESCELLVVIGTGGSYLGAKAGYELLRPAGGPELMFAGWNLSAEDLLRKLRYAQTKDFCVNVISKSGTTMEPALAFRAFRELLQRRYSPEEANRRIIYTTDREKGVLRRLARETGAVAFEVPEDVGGRYSVLSAVGLLPLMAAGADGEAMLASAERDFQLFRTLRGAENPAHRYAALRTALYRQGYSTEILAAYEPSARWFAEWWKQLYGESEGKDGSGIFPASVEYTADLHSMGQYIQDGPRNLMETVLRFDRVAEDYPVPSADTDDGLSYLDGKTVSDICRVAADSVAQAHIAGGVPNMAVRAGLADEDAFGSLVAFFEYSCALSALLQGVNPFNQPGVEAYKKAMFRNLGKSVE